MKNLFCALFACAVVTVSCTATVETETEEMAAATEADTTCSPVNTQCNITPTGAPCFPSEPYAWMCPTEATMPTYCDYRAGYTVTCGTKVYVLYCCEHN